MSTTKFCPVAQWTRVTHLFERTRGQTTAAAAAAAFLWRPAIDLFFSCFDYECCVSNWRKWRDLFCKLRISGERNGERLRPNRSLPNCQKNKPNVRHALAFVSINLLIRGKPKCLGRQLLWPFSILGAFYQVLKALSLWQQEPFQQGGELSVVYPLFRWPSLKRFLRPRLEYCCKCILKPLRFLQIPPRQLPLTFYCLNVKRWSVPPGACSRSARCLQQEHSSRTWEPGWSLLTSCLTIPRSVWLRHLQHLLLKKKSFICVGPDCVVSRSETASALFAVKRKERKNQRG